MGVYAAVFSYLGFVVASVLFMQAAFFVLGERSLLISVSVSVGLVAFLWIFLTQVFGLYLDKGALFSALVE
jgi:putative tricarboxylic transport membrane protein